MFDRFTDNAKRAMAGSRDSALALRRDSIDSEDVLLGLLRVADSTAARMVAATVDPAKLEEAVLAATKRGDVRDLPRNLPFTPRAKKVLEHSMEEAIRAGDSFIGTQHLIIGVASVECPGARVLAEHDLDVPGLRRLARNASDGFTPPAEPSGDFPIHEVRRQFPGLRREVGGRPAVLLDGPAGSQVPQRVIDAMSFVLAHRNANRGGAFPTSREAAELVDGAREAVADFVGASTRDEIVFGPCMTALCFQLAHSLARGWKRGDEVAVTRLDHDANVTPWVVAAERAGASVQHAGIRAADCTLDMGDLERKLTARTRVVAVVAASNLSGSITDVARIAEHARAVDAHVVVDAVHYAPHRSADVQAWDCDFLLCSPYKFFGPHMGVLWGRRSLLAGLPVDNLRPAPKTVPESWELGTQNHEGIAGTLAAIDYLADLGRAVAGHELPRRRALLAAFDAITRYENGLSQSLLAGLSDLAGFRVHGIADPARVSERTPTFGLTHERRRPKELAEALAARGVFAWHGNCYALPPSDALGLEPDGVLRVGFLHYNTADEVERLLETLAAVSS